MSIAPHENDVPDYSNARCKGQPVHWWYPSEKTTREQVANTRNAIAICRDCPLQFDCLEYSLKWEPVGIWGGYTESERHRLRKNRNIVCVRPVGGVRTSRREVKIND